MRVLIVGGSDAGTSAALRICELDRGCEVTVALADSYPNFSICGLPFFLSGEVSDWHDLAHRSSKDLEDAGIELLCDHSAQSVDPQARRVALVTEDGTRKSVAYDRLVLATGAVSLRSPIDGIDLPGVFLLRWMNDSFAMHCFVEQCRPRRAVIVGGGYIGLEMADALALRGLEVTLLELAGSVLGTVHESLGRAVAVGLERKGVQVRTHVRVEAIEKHARGLTVRCAEAASVETDMVLVAAGAKPATDLAQTAGVGLGAKGAIAVDRRMRTGVPDIFAAGDCVQTWHRIIQRNDYLPLGTTAHKQGRVAGENALGAERSFAGSLGTQVVKLFDQVVARTGLREAQARAAGFDARTIAFEAPDHKAYYPGAKPISFRITGDRSSGRLLGAQMLGHTDSEIAKRIDIFATALFHEMKLADLSDLDLSYTPPLSSPWDPVQMAAQAWVHAIRRDSPDHHPD